MMGPFLTALIANLVGWGLIIGLLLLALYVTERDRRRDRWK